MAAVVASLASILAGCSLGGQGLSGGGSGFVGHDPAQERELGGREGRDRRSSSFWEQTQSAALGVTTAFAESLSIKSAAPKAVTAEAARPRVAEPPETLPLSIASPTAAVDLSDLAVSAAGAEMQDNDKTGEKTCGDRTGRRVHFDLTKCTEHEVTPYSEVYGIHPRDFDFGRGLPAPVPCFVDPHAKPLPEARMIAVDLDSDDEEECAFRGRGRAKARHALGLRQVPRHLWVVLCVGCFLVRAFGTEAFLEILPEVMSSKLA